MSSAAALRSAGQPSAAARGFKAFYVAVGLQKAAKLKIPGEELKGVLGGLDFLRSVNNGKTKKLSGDVVVIGGGNAAIDVARAARRLTKGSVSMYCAGRMKRCPQFPMRRTQASPTALLSAIPGRPEAILGGGGKVTGIELMRCVSVRDASGKFAPVYDENETITVSCSNVLVAIGKRSEYGAVLAGTAAETPDGSLIDHNGVTFQTEEADIFVGGDCATGPKYTIDAIASGREGTSSIHRYVNVGQTLTIHRNLREFKELDKENITQPAEKFKKPARAEVAIDKEPSPHHAGRPRDLHRADKERGLPLPELRPQHRRSQQVHRLRHLHHQSASSTLSTSSATVLETTR